MTKFDGELVETTSAIVAAGGRAHAIVAGLAAPGAGTALARRARDQLGRVDILMRVGALSVDDEATARQTIAEHGLEFPVGHDADPDAVAAATGAFVNDAPRYLQSTGFVRHVREHEAEERAA